MAVQEEEEQEEQETEEEKEKARLVAESQVRCCSSRETDTVLYVAHTN